jgi:hypothetical protein
MKTSDIRSLSKYLLPHMPTFVYKGRLLYASPLNHVLRAFHFDSSAFDKETFYVTVFYLPLYVPSSHIHLGFGERLRSSKGQAWNLSDPRLREELLACIQQQGLPFLEAVKQPCDVVAAIQRHGVGSDPYELEAIAYSLVMTGDVTAAQQALERLTKVLDTSVPWQAEMRARAMALAGKLNIAPQEARRQLAEWEQATVKNLGLG